MSSLSKKNQPAQQTAKPSTSEPDEAVVTIELSLKLSQPFPSIECTLSSLSTITDSLESSISREALKWVKKKKSSYPFRSVELNIKSSCTSREPSVTDSTSATAPSS